MKSLTTAIYSKATGSAFSTSIGGRLYKGRVPQNAAHPHAMFFVVTDMPAGTFTEEIEDVTVQFSIFSVASGTTEIEDIFTNLRTLYDNCSLTITGSTHLLMSRQNAELVSIPADTALGTGEYWQYDIDFNVLLKRD